MKAASIFATAPPPVPKGVYTSTLAVYSDTHGRLVDERYYYPGPFLSAYDRTKWEAHYLVALKPEVSSDGLSVHLALTDYVAQHHYWPFDVKNVTWAAMPMGGDWAYTIANMLGGETAARLLNFARECGSRHLVKAIPAGYCFAWGGWSPRGGAKVFAADQTKRADAAEDSAARSADSEGERSRQTGNDFD